MGPVVDVGRDVIRHFLFLSADAPLFDRYLCSSRKKGHTHDVHQQNKYSPTHLPPLLFLLIYRSSLSLWIIIIQPLPRSRLLLLLHTARRNVTMQGRPLPPPPTRQEKEMRAPLISSRELLRSSLTLVFFLATNSEGEEEEI